MTHDEALTVNEMSFAFPFQCAWNVLGENWRAEKCPKWIRKIWKIDFLFYIFFQFLLASSRLLPLLWVIKRFNLFINDEHNLANCKSILWSWKLNICHRDDGEKVIRSLEFVLFIRVITIKKKTFFTIILCSKLKSEWRKVSSLHTTLLVEFSAIKSWMLLLFVLSYPFVLFAREKKNIGNRNINNFLLIFHFKFFSFLSLCTLLFVSIFIIIKRAPIHSRSPLSQCKEERRWTMSPSSHFNLRFHAHINVPLSLITFLLIFFRF